MKKKFNITGLCVPHKHYMVNIDKRLSQIRELVDDGAYFTINRARQFGKTTTLNILATLLEKDYFVVSLDFQALGYASFEDENSFALTFASYFLRESRWGDCVISPQLDKALKLLKTKPESKGDRFVLFDLFDCLLDICLASPKPIILMIDEVDSATNNQVFLDFLAQLRNCYLEREKKGIPTFWSVILAGVYDVKNLKGKIRTDEEHGTNSPWNIAADFDVDMSFSQSDITGMLEEYEHDCQTGMDMEEMSKLIYDYSSGYPFLVSRLCKLIDEKIYRGEQYSDGTLAWTKAGFLEAMRLLLMEKNTLFESLIGKLTDYPKLNKMLYTLLFSGKSVPFNPMNPVIDIAAMFGFIKNSNGLAVPANRIFDTILYNYYLSSEEMHNQDKHTS